MLCLSPASQSLSFLTMEIIYSAHFIDLDSAGEGEGSYPFRKCFNVFVLILVFGFILCEISHHEKQSHSLQKYAALKQ